MAESIARYSRAPIVEAVIELQFAAEASWEQVSSAADRLKPAFFFDDTENEQGFSMGPNNLKIASRPFGRLLTTLEGTDVTIVRLMSFLSSRRAPYQSWEPLLTRFLSNWTTVKKDLGTRPLAQMGVRFINRIDIPLSAGEAKPINSYLRVGLQFPEQIGKGPLLGFTTQFERDLDERFLVKMTVALVESPVPNCAGILLDIDVIWRANRVVRDDEIESAAARMRDWKNTIFELSITDHVRELII